MKLTDDLASAVMKWTVELERKDIPAHEKLEKLHMAISEHTQPIETKLIDWIEALGYACNDVDISLSGGDEEAVEQVEETYKDLLAFATEQEIDWKEELEKRGAMAESDSEKE